MAKKITITIEIEVDAAAGAGDVLDPEALIRAIESYRPYLRQQAAKAIGSDVRSKEDASDIVQDTCVRAIEGIHRFRGDARENLRNWLHTIMTNHVKKSARRYRRTAKRRVDREVSLDEILSRRVPDSGLQNDSTSPSGHAMRTEQLDSLCGALSQLPLPDRQVVLMRAVNRLTFKEIGLELGCSAVAARKRYLRVLDQLRVGMKRSPRESSDFRTPALKVRPRRPR